MNRKVTIASIAALFLVLNFVLVSAFQQRQELRSQAVANTSLSFYPPSSFESPMQGAVGQPISFDLRMAPGNNKVTRLQVHIVFPKATYSIAGTTFVVNSEVFPEVVSAPKVTEGLNGDVNFTVSNPAGIGYEAKVGTLTLTPQKVVAAANQNDGVVGFLPVTSATSIREGDLPTENVVAQLNQAYIFVGTQAVPTNVLSNPTLAPTLFTCLGSCPTGSPVSPTIVDEKPVEPSGSDTPKISPTPCPAGTMVTSSDSQLTTQHRGGKRGGWWKKRGGRRGGSDAGLLQIILKLLELLLQLLGGGTTPKPGVTPTQPGGGDPCKPVTTIPVEPPQTSETPEPSEPPTASEAPQVSPSAPVSAAVCGKKTAGATAGSLSSCSGLTATEPTSNGLYGVTNFGCNVGFPKDGQDNCIPACSGTPECSGLDGRACEEKVIWYSANADQYGCNSKLKVTNPKTGKAVILRALDKGPGCAIQKSKGIFDMSQAAYKEINGDDGVVQVEEVDESTPLGPIPACTQ